MIEKLILMSHNANTHTHTNTSVSFNWYSSYILSKVRAAIYTRYNSQYRFVFDVAISRANQNIAIIYLFFLLLADAVSVI